MDHRQKDRGVGKIFEGKEEEMNSVKPKRAKGERLQVGMKILHPQWGIGEIKNRYPNGQEFFVQFNIPNGFMKMWRSELTDYRRAYREI